MKFFELLRHTHKHRQRVRHLATATGYPFSFGERVVIKVHDVEKYFFIPWLYKYSSGKGDRIAARALYDRMNRVGDFIRALVHLVFLVDRNPVIDDIERIADVTDRYCHPDTLKEMGLLKKIHYSNFLKPHQIPQAERLISRYRQIIPARLM